MIVGFSWCVMDLSTWPVHCRRYLEHLAGDLDSSFITGKIILKIKREWEVEIQISWLTFFLSWAADPSCFPPCSCILITYNKND